jgi:hypothetical protein
MIARETQEYAWGLGNGAGEVSRCFGCGSAARYFGISVREERKTGAKRLVLSLSPKHRNTETPKHRNTETPKHRNTETPKHRNTEFPRVNGFLSGDPRGRQTTLQNALAKKIINIKVIYIEPVSSLFVKTLEKLGVSSSVFRLLPLLSIQNQQSSILPLTSDI